MSFLFLGSTYSAVVDSHLGTRHSTKLVYARQILRRYLCTADPISLCRTKCIDHGYSNSRDPPMFAKTWISILYASFHTRFSCLKSLKDNLAVYSGSRSFSPNGVVLWWVLWKVSLMGRWKRRWGYHWSSTRNKSISSHSVWRGSLCVRKHKSPILLFFT